MSAEGRRAIVTGAGSGIGQEVALQLLAAGARVTGVDINDRGLDPVRDAGGEAMVVDLADLTQRASVIASAREDPPNYLVNAAAILDVIALSDVDEAVFRRHFTVNVEAPWFLCRDIGGALVEGGAIVNFSSPSARWAYTLSSNRTKLVPLARSAPPSEMAGVVFWLLSDATSYITGQTIYVDGGYIMSA